LRSLGSKKEFCVILLKDSYKEEIIQPLNGMNYGNEKKLGSEIEESFELVYQANLNQLRNEFEISARKRRESTEQSPVHVESVSK
jgi:hypothetical protein